MLATGGTAGSNSVKPRPRSVRGVAVTATGAMMPSDDGHSSDVTTNAVD